MRRRTALLLSTVAAMACPSVLWAARPARPRLTVSTLANIRYNVDGVDTEPINGFTPQIIMGLTNEQDSDDANSGVEGFGIASSTPGGSSLPIGASAPQYAVATLDSGSSADIISYDSAQAFDLADASLEGGNTTTIAGASGTEDVYITNALGVYATDFSNATISNGSISVAAGSLKGQYNVPALEGNQGDGLPNIVGSPILSQYRVTIQNSQPQHLTVGGVAFQTPKVTFSAFNASIPTGYSKLTLKTADPVDGGAEGEPSPYYINYNLTGPTDPDTPGVWASLVTNGGVGLSRDGNSATNQTFLLDTGAQVTVISNDTAAELGIFNANASNADFTVQVQGVGGITNVPGYYLNNMTLLTQGGLLTWNRVPVIVLDVADPRDPTSALPGILGTNLFSDRDLILNTNVGTTAQTYLAIGPQMQWQHSSGGLWSNASNWAVVLPNGEDMQANFYGAITAASTINVDGNYTVGRITFDNASKYTLSGAGTITMLDSTDQSQINIRSGSHLIATPVILGSDTIVTVIPNTSTLTMSGVVSSNGSFGITESGFGTLLLSAGNTYTGATNVSSGTITVTGSINGSTSVMTSIGATLNAAGVINAGLSAATVLDSNGVTNIGPNTGTSGPAAVTLASIEIGSDPTSLVAVNASASHANRTVLVTSSLTFDSTTDGQLDLKNNDMIVHGSTLAAVMPLIESGSNLTGGSGGYWNGSGIISSTAAADSRFLTTLGVIVNNNGLGAAIYGSGTTLGLFDRQSTVTGDILIKYTYYGDANLDGRVDGSDYTLIDYGYLNHLTGWYRGDFNYDGVVDGSDYTLIDNAFNSQGANLAAEVATITAEAAASPAGTTPVPEPASAAAMICLTLLARRRRRNRN